MIIVMMQCWDLLPFPQSSLHLLLPFYIQTYIKLVNGTCFIAPSTHVCEWHKLQIFVARRKIIKQTVKTNKESRNENHDYGKSVI